MSTRRIVTFIIMSKIAIYTSSENYEVNGYEQGLDFLIILQ
jgi:hypothetical protein